MDKEQSQRKRKRAEEESIEGASTSSSISPKTIGVGSNQYDVFLSFRGLDTCKTFTHHLYHSLVEAGMVPVPFYVFRDENSIPIDEEFASEILDAIAQSKISIPIISENYASSKRCLCELGHIIKCKKSMSHIVLPIFYKVAPLDVRHLKGNIGNVFRSIHERFDEKDIQEWQQALSEVSELNGWESQEIADRHEEKLIECVVKTVLSKLQKDFQLDVPKQLVGLDGHLKKIMNWIDSPSNDARMIGIYGMGGMGKTSLAKCIYNQLSKKFVHVSFLPNVRETTRCNGHTYLQSQLISDILQSKCQVSRIDDGINIIKSRFKGKNVLILLDDIDSKDQLDILVGERNWFMAGSLIIVTTRNKAILDQSNFEVDYKYELNELDEEHALLLFNRHAFRMDHSLGDFKGLSRDIVSTMGGLPLAIQVVGSYLYRKTNRKVWEDVWKQLKNQPHGHVQKILQTSYDALEDGHKQIFLDIACFLIGEESKFAMYMWEDCGFYPNQGIEELKLRCLIKSDDKDRFKMHDQMRDLARSIFCREQPLDEHSGPWDDNYKGVPRVLRHLEKRLSWFRDLTRPASSRNSNQLLSEVRWLQWSVFGSDLSLSTINLHLPKLSVLELSNSEITEDWKEWSSFMASRMLKVLNLTNCLDLRCTPDLSTLTQLKILILSYCSKLQHLHPSVGKLTSLVSLDLRDCYSLKELPEEVGGLKDLEELLLDGASGITEIPMSICSLRKLKKLSAKFCKSLREISSSIGDLQNLQHLNLTHSGIEKLPNAIGELKNLQTLHLSSCDSLKGAIPSEIGDLPSLEILDLACTPISDLPESIHNLSFLQRLYLSSCKKLWSLPELPLGLTYLSISCQSPRFPQLSSLIHLEELHLELCPLLEYIPELSSRVLKLCVQGCDKLILLKLNGSKYLEEFSIINCSSIERLDLSQLVRLKELHVEHCNNLVEIQGHNNLESLEVIFIYDCNSIKSLLCPESRCLKKLVAARCHNMVKIQGLNGGKFLEELDFTGCRSMDTLPNLIGCEKLRSLRVRDCKKLTQLQGLEKLDLIDLDISGCDSLEAIPKLFGTRVFTNYERELSFD